MARAPSSKCRTVPPSSTPPPMMGLPMWCSLPMRLLYSATDLGGLLVATGDGRAQHNRDQALQQPVVVAVLGKLADDLGLDAAEDGNRKVRDEQRAAPDAVDGVRARRSNVSQPERTVLCGPAALEYFSIEPNQPDSSS